MHLHLASHLGTLDEPREGRDVGAESKDGVWWTYPEDGRTGQVLGWEILANRVSGTNTNLVLDPRQASKHSKAPMFLQISLKLFMFDALGYKS